MKERVSRFIKSAILAVGISSTLAPAAVPENADAQQAFVTDNITQPLPTFYDRTVPLQCFLGYVGECRNIVLGNERIEVDRGFVIGRLINPDGTTTANVIMPYSTSRVVAGAYASPIPYGPNPGVPVSPPFPFR